MYDDRRSEARFRMLQYRPDDAARFESVDTARAWCRDLLGTCNHDHDRSGIAYLRPVFSGR